MELLYSLSIILFCSIIDMIILRELVYFYPMAFEIDVDVNWNRDMSVETIVRTSCPVVSRCNSHSCIGHVGY